ncbi:MAG: putative DNA binding domain-containing protein [Comamonadaceae bacterium]|nr:putative DNA binding domain-containing protein [Comamonadaceae bacterium]
MDSDDEPAGRTHELDVNAKLLALHAMSAENEVVEFKEAKNGYDFTKLGKYFSALCNEANLKRQPSAWLVFGVNDQRQVVGSNFRSVRKDLDSLKEEIANKTTNRITFIEIHEVAAKGGCCCWRFRCAQGLPVAFDGHYYGRDGEALSPLNLEEIERIRAQSTHERDWSAVIVPRSRQLADLDEEARPWRGNFKSKFPDKAAEVDGWDTPTFLNKAKLTIKGRVTRAALLLLGREEAEHFLLPAEAKIRWLLKDHLGQDRDYALFGLPMLLAVDKVYAKIRNLKYRYIREGTLFPEEIDQYEPYAIREALNNCIAHQGLHACGRINVVEQGES